MTAAPKRKLTVFIGRFSPFHKGHAELLERALNLSERVLVIIGSADQPRTIKNPWTVNERAWMISEWHRYSGDDRRDALIFKSVRDHPYNNQRWLADVQKVIAEVAAANGVAPEDDIYITGADRDQSTFYLKEFPTYKLDLVEENREVSKEVSATSVRDLYFGQMLNGRKLSPAEITLILSAFVPKQTLEFLADFGAQAPYFQLVNEYRHITSYQKAWEAAPYKPTFVTVDSVVVQTGHVLLVKRRSEPGKGLWALPGGFLNENEWMLDGAVRELREETRLKVPEPVIRGSLKHDQVFDQPGRSLRGRTITRAFLFHLPDHVIDGRVELPAIRGSDDAEEARWFTLAEALSMSEQLFEDHYAIIETMLGKL